MSNLVLYVASPAFLSLLACLDHDPVPGQEGSYVAMQADFAGYASWAAFPVEGAAAGHAGDARTVYINRLPEEFPGGDPSGTAFSVGTILVKVAERDPADTGATGPEVHAMVKRGGGYNPGAPGWEWFDLALSGGVPVINWRGEGPPEGGGYQSGAIDTANPDGDCNACHAAAYDNDFVHTVALTGMAL